MSISRKIAGGALAAATAAAMLAACGTNSSSAGGSTGAVSQPSAVAKLTGSIAFNDTQLGKLRDQLKQALAGKDLSQANVAVVVNVTAAYWDAAREGVQKAASELNVKARFQEPTQQDISEQLSIVNTLLSQGITGMSISAIQPSSLSGAVAGAKSRGTDLMAIDSPLPSFRPTVPLYLGTPNFEAGQKAGQAMKQLLPNGGDVAIVVGSLTATNATQRIAGFKSVLAGTKVHVFQTYNDNGDANKALEDSSAAFQADPNLKGFYGVYSYDGPSAGQAVQSAGKAGKVVVVADDSEPKTLQLLNQGAIQATVLQQPYQQGYLSVYLLTAMKVLGVPATMKIVRPYLGSDGYTLSSGVGLVTKANLAAYNAKMAAMGVTP
ncbi:MAG TPA: substrate-binding domain-containing protein [Pseudonocardiaceae bacterium]|nr:substrate-binding domain-containing protein [Pseudonocardiaceae bacterium]